MWSWRCRRPGSMCAPWRTSTTSPARARAFREVRAQLPAADKGLVAAVQSQFGALAPFGPPSAGGVVTLHCPPDQVHALASFLRERGADAVSIAQLDYVFTKENPL